MKQKIEGVWVETVRSWYCGYSEHEKLLVLNTQERMVNFISDLLASERQRCVDSLPKKIGESRNDRLFETPMGVMDLSDEEVEVFNQAIDQSKHNLLKVK